MVSEDEQLENNQQDQGSSGILSKLKKYASANNKKPFFYQLGQFQFSLDEIKHGLLRGNQKSPFNYTRSLGVNDERLSLIDDSSVLDARVNFICLDFPSFLEHMDEFDGSSEEDLDQAMDKYVSEIINAKVSID